MENPYATSETDLSEHADADVRRSAGLFALNGRIGRLRFLAYFLISASFLWIVFMFTMGLAGVMFDSRATRTDFAFYGSLIAMGGFCLLYFLFARRRLQDTDDPWWLALLALVPFINRIFWLYLIFRGGTEGENGYGMPPPKNSVWVYLGTLVPLAGIVASVAIPAFQHR